MNFDPIATSLPSAATPASGTVPQQLVLLAARFWPDTHGGVETRLLHTARAFARHGCQVTVLTEQRENWPQVQQMEPNLTVRRLPAMDAGRLWRWREALRVRWWRRGIVQHAPAHAVIWATDPLMAMGAILAGRSRTMVFNPACCAAAMNRIAQRYPHIFTMRQPRLLCQLDRLAYRFAARVVISSENLRRQFGQCYGWRKSVHVIPHGIDAEQHLPDRAAARKQWNIASDATVFGFVGRLDPCKDLPFLLEAVARLPLGPHDRVLLAGDGPDRARLERIASGLDMTWRLVWTGKLSDPAAAYAAMDVMVLPSVYEAYGNVLLEAMAAGVPVIGRHGDGQTIMTATDEIIDPRRTGLIVNTQDPIELSQHLQQLMQDTALRQRLGQNARETALQRPWERVAEDYLTLLTQSAASQNASASRAA